LDELRVVAPSLWHLEIPEGETGGQGDEFDSGWDVEDSELPLTAVEAKVSNEDERYETNGRPQSDLLAEVIKANENNGSKEKSRCKELEHVAQGGASIFAGYKCEYH